MIGAITAGLFSTGAAAGGGSSYESIATVLVGAGGSTAIQFNSIPSTYKHLQIRAMSPSGGYANIRFNGDTTAANYRYHYINGTGSGTPSAGTGASNAYLPAAGGWSSSGPMALVADILDYQNTNKYKTVRALDGFEPNAAGGEINFYSDLWMSTSAITSIELSRSGVTFGQYSSFALYGIKG